MAFRVPRRFSLAAAATVLTAISIAIGLWSDRAHRQRAAVEAFQRVNELGPGVIVVYSDQAWRHYNLDYSSVHSDEPKPRPLIALAQNSSFRDYLYDVVAVYTASPGFSDIEMTMLGNLPKLVNLSLRGTNITSRGAAYVERCPMLEHLDLSGTPVNDWSISHIIKLKHLKELELNWTEVSDDGALRLSDLSNGQASVL